MGEVNIEKIGKMVPDLIDMPSEHIWIDYDREVDTLYISFRKPQKATNSVLEENMILNYDGDELVGITVMNAKKIVKGR